MTLPELNEWIKSAKHVDGSQEEYDSSTNKYYFRIYEKDGKFFKIEFMNDHPFELYVKGKGFTHDEYNPTPMKKISWMEYRQDWEEI